MDTKIALDFILTKTQRDAYIIDWKQRHAKKEHFTSFDFLLHAFLNPAVIDIEKKAKQAFAPSENEYLATAYLTALSALRYRAMIGDVKKDILTLDKDQLVRIYSICNAIINSNGK